MLDVFGEFFERIASGNPPDLNRRLGLEGKNNHVALLDSVDKSPELAYRDYGCLGLLIRKELAIHSGEIFFALECREIRQVVPSDRD